MHRLILILSLIWFIISTQSHVKAKIDSFSIDLIHRDSTLSPLYNSSITPSKLLRKAVVRSLNRVNHFNSSIHVDGKDIETGLTPNEDGYLMNIFMGQGHTALAVASTISELTWIKCCRECTEQNKHLFDPQQSTSYKEISSDEQYCKDFQNTRKDESTEECKYNYKYGKRGFTDGTLSTENFHLYTDIHAFSALVFGCSYHDTVNFKPLVQGVVGLGQGYFSLMNQLKKKIFSYCLLPISSKTPSKLVIGEKAKIDGDKVSIPFSYQSNNPFYNLRLDHVNVEGKEAFATSSHRDMIIDSGSRLTSFYSSIYEDLRSIVKKVIGIPTVKDETKTFDLCYSKGETFEVFPIIEVHFMGGYIISLDPTNMFAEYESMICMMIVPTDGVSVLGNMAQVNFQVEYDLKKRTVSFATRDCATFRT